MIGNMQRELADLGVRPLILVDDWRALRGFGPRPGGDREREAVWLRDPSGAIAKAFNIGKAGAALLLNENQRVVAVWDSSRLPKNKQALLTLLGNHLPQEESFTEAKAHAPVLRIPGVFSPDCCKHLIEVFESSPHQASGFNEEREGGAPIVFDEKVKKRRDFIVESKTPLAEQIRAIYLRRLIPEIAKVFHFEVKSHEAFKLARYDSEDSGFFQPHRDNTNRANAHRRFAVSINLNAEDHRGGHLVFPEYSSAGYRPATGEALVFCCSLLHEARPVTRGQRYVQLAFLY